MQHDTCTHMHVYCNELQFKVKPKCNKQFRKEFHTLETCLIQKNINISLAFRVSKPLGSCTFHCIVPASDIAFKPTRCWGERYSEPERIRRELFVDGAESGIRSKDMSGKPAFGQLGRGMFNLNRPRLKHVLQNGEMPYFIYLFRKWYHRRSSKYSVYYFCPIWTKSEMPQILVKIPSVKFYSNLSSESRKCFMRADRMTDGWTDMMKLVAGFRKLLSERA
jgi:hypothetical protein